MLQCQHPRSSNRKRRRDGCDHRVSYQSKQPVFQSHNAANGSVVPRAQSESASKPASAASGQNSSSSSYYLAVYNCLLQWCCRLKALQPKCIISKEVLHRSLDLFHRYRQALQLQNQTSRKSQGDMHCTAAHLAACLWLASKSDGNRACVPSRTLLTRAIAVCPELLSQAELTICCKLNWNILNSQVATAFQQ